MSRAVVLPLLILAFLPLACRLPPEREPLRSLPPDGLGLTYDELNIRAKVQFEQALDAFYLDAWDELEKLGKGLEETARFLPKSSEPPAGLKVDLLLKSKELRTEAVRLAEAARARDAKVCSTSLRDINLHLRALRPPTPPAPVPAPPLP